MNTIIVAIITSLGVIANTIITKRVSNSEVLKRIKKLEKKIEDVEINQIKQYLIRAMSYMEKESIDKEELMYFYEQYDRYTNHFHKNSYVHDKYQNLRKSSKL